MRNFSSLINNNSSSCKLKLAKSIAFTLSEVLITLGVIGVVAAMTIPTIMTKIQDRVLKQQYRKSFSTFNQALKQLYYNTDTEFLCSYGTYSTGGGCKKYDDKGECVQWISSSSNGGGWSQCPQFYKELRNVLKVSHSCEDNAYKKHCIPKYKGLDTIYKDNNKDNDSLTDYDVIKATTGVAGFREEKILKNNPAWVLQDGTIMTFYGKYSAPLFLVDVNGSKGPNRWGYDMFVLKVISDGNGKIYFSPSNSSLFREKGGKTGSQMLQ